ncbi:MAG: hypothetical protein IPL84_00720 [Chitinophagaceae bacterium]|nr:hypothetical protein [Chitinophagaceae bacterium]
MKKLFLLSGLIGAGFAGIFAQSPVQNATLTTSIPTMIALRPYNASLPGDNQTLSTAVTTAGVFANNIFNYTTGTASGYDGLAYRIYSNVTYKVDLQAQTTPGSNDQLNNYILFHAETLPSPQNGIAPWATNNNGDHAINQATDLQLAYATAPLSTNLLSNAGYNTGFWLPPGNPFLPLDPMNTDFAAFGIKFIVSPGFSVFPGTFTTNLTVTASPL